jgi:isopenicillin-N N-acyltransferase like protein
MLLRLITLTLISLYLPACAYFRADPWHYSIRSDIITTPEKEKEILSKAKLSWTSDGRVRVIYLEGTAYERGYQQGALLRNEVRDNLEYLYKEAVKKFYFAELFDEAYERMRPFISQDYVDEMQGLAHGSRLPLSLIHAIHALPEVGEWDKKKELRAILKKMIAGEYATSCSNISVTGAASGDGNQYTLRVLDWGLHRISKLHQYPLIAIHKPVSEISENNGIVHANIGWIGFLGAVSGMNAQGITLGEMGYGGPPNETLRGKPMPFLLRDVLAHANNLSDVRKIISESPGTNSYVFLMSDGKSNEAELYVRDRDRFLVFKPGEEIIDDNRAYPGLKDAVFGGPTSRSIDACVQENYGQITPNTLMTNIVPKIALASNFQNVIYDPKNLKFWVSNALSREEPAYSQPYTEFNLKEYLQQK